MKRGVLTAMTGIAARGGNQVILLVVTLVAARFLSPTDFGIFAIASVGVTLIRTLLYSGAFEYLLKSDEPDAAATECLIVNLALSVTITALLLAFVPLSEPVFGAAAIGAVIVQMAPSNLLAAATAWQESQVLRAGRIRGYYVVTTVGEVVAAVVALVMLATQMGLAALVAQLYVRLAVLLAGYLVLQRSRFSDRITFARTLQVARWSASRYGAVLVSFVSQYGADVLLGAFLSPAASGLYRASSRIVAAVADMFAQPTRILAVTLFSARAAQGSPVGDLWPGILSSSAFLGWAAMAGLAMTASDLVPLLLGEQWSAAPPIVAVLCLARALNLLDAVTAPLLVSQNRQLAVLAVQTTASVVLVVGLFVFVHSGPASAAWVTAAAAGVLTLGLLILTARTAPATAAALRTAALLSLTAPLAILAGGGLGLLLARGLTAPPLGEFASVFGVAVVALLAVGALQYRSLLAALSALSPAEAPAAVPADGPGTN